MLLYLINLTVTPTKFSLGLCPFFFRFRNGYCPVSIRFRAMVTVSIRLRAMVIVSIRVRAIVIVFIGSGIWFSHSLDWIWIRDRGWMGLGLIMVSDFTICHETSHITSVFQDNASLKNLNLSYQSHLHKLTCQKVAVLFWVKQPNPEMLVCLR